MSFHFLKDLSVCSLYPHTAIGGGRHFVENAQLDHKISFRATKNAALYLRIGGIRVAAQPHSGTRDQKIRYAREILTQLEDKQVLRSVIDGAITRTECRLGELNRHAKYEAKIAQALRNLDDSL